MYLPRAARVFPSCVCNCLQVKIVFHTVIAATTSGRLSILVVSSRMTERSDIFYFLPVPLRGRLLTKERNMTRSRACKRKKEKFCLSKVYNSTNSLTLNLTASS